MLKSFGRLQGSNWRSFAILRGWLFHRAHILYLLSSAVTRHSFLTSPTLPTPGQPYMSS